MQVTTVVYLLAAVGIVLIGLGIYGVIRERFPQETSGSAPGVTFNLPLSALVLLMGIGSIGGSGYFALNGSKSVTPAPGTQVGTVKPTGTRSAVALPNGAVTIISPAFGAKVEACGVFYGTSNLAPGETLILAAQNLSDSTKTFYLQPVNNWRKPAELSKWTGFQYFGSGDTSVGQTFEISVLVIKADVVTAALAQPANTPTWAVKSLPGGANVKTTIRVVREKGPGPAVCH